jgi:hypothetical protein
MVETTNGRTIPESLHLQSRIFFSSFWQESKYDILGKTTQSALMILKAWETNENLLYEWELLLLLKKIINDIKSHQEWSVKVFLDEKSVLNKTQRKKFAERNFQLKKQITHSIEVLEALYVRI